MFNFCSKCGEGRRLMTVKSKVIVIILDYPCVIASHTLS